MKRNLKLTLVCLLFLALTGASLAETNLTELVGKTQPAVVTIQTYDQNKEPLGQGTGFFINTNTLITNYHVLREAHKAETITYEGKKYPITQVIAENEKMDLIKLSVDIPQEVRKSISYLSLDKSLPSIAENILVIGSPFGLEQTVSEGIISSVRLVLPVGTLLQISAPISHGSSGSPVLNMKGEVVGIVSFFISEGQNLNFAVPAEYISNLEPMGTPKRISTWSEQEMCRLYVHTEPEGTRIRILNIKPKFFQGIALEPGRYHIEVSSDGYMTRKWWIKIEPGEYKNLRISLEKNSLAPPKDPISTDAAELTGKGLGHMFEGEYIEAIQFLKECVRIDPHPYFCLSLLGEAYARSNLYRDAIDVLKESIRIYPEVSKNHFWLGYSYFNLGLSSQAIDELRLAIQYKPYDDEEAYKTYVMLGDSYGQLGHFTEAIEAYKKAIEINPDCADAYANLAIVCGVSGRHYEAIEACKKVLRMQPGHLMAIMTLAAAYTNLGRHTEAIDTQKQAIRINPDHPMAHFGLGAAYLRSGDRSSALDQYKILKDLDKELANQLFNLIYE